MSRKLIPVSKRQHDAVNEAVAAIRKQQEVLQIAANAIILGQDDEIPQYGIVGAECSTDGVYSLVLEIPDIAPKADPTPADAQSA